MQWLLILAGLGLAFGVHRWLGSKLFGTSGPNSSAEQISSRNEAAAILGIAIDASHDEIMGAHRRLMQAIHPDKGGSDYLARQLNAARDRLLESPDL